MSRPTLSVITPNYNHGKYIARAIEAVVSQSRPPDEYLILDDGSTDNSVEIIESYAHRYPYIRFIQHEQNKGVVASVEHLVSMATGDYLYAGAADDYVLPGFFEKVMDMAEQYPEAGIICGQMVVVDPTGKELCLQEVTRWQKSLFASPDKFRREYLDVEYPTHFLSVSTIFRKSALDEVGGFRPELGYWCDAFATQAIALKYGAYYLAEPCAVWRKMSDGYARSSSLDTRLALDLASRAAWLMRSPKFRDRFPEEYVNRWEERYRCHLINVQLWRFRESFDLARQTYHQGLFAGNWLDRLLGVFFSKWIHLERGVWTRLLRRTLNRYDGDISCYLGSDNMPDRRT
jgi:glycosyltransferase involved in cell wall biosynthesis